MIFCSFKLLVCNNELFNNKRFTSASSTFFKIIVYWQKPVLNCRTLTTRFAKIDLSKFSERKWVLSRFALYVSNRGEFQQEICMVQYAIFKYFS